MTEGAEPGTPARHALRSARVLLGCLWPAAAAAGLILGFYTVGIKYTAGLKLDLGSVAFPRQATLTFIALWSCFSALASGALALSLARVAALLGGRRMPTLLSSERLLVATAGIAGTAIPLSLRVFAFDGAPFADDESSYRFMAELIASGRLYAESHPMPEFFSRGFMINDGRFYAQYFLGWPTILAIGQLLGVPWLVSPLCSGLTAMAAVRVTRRVVGIGAARVALLVYLASPMLMLGAATDLSHTSCIAALAWMTWFFLRTRDPDGSPLAFAAVVTCFGVAFFIRPLAALGIGAPLLVFTIWPVLWRPRAREWVALATPALVLGGLFLLVNQIQNGSPLTTAYQRIVEYSQENAYQFAGMPRDFLETGGDVPAFRFELIWHLAISANTLFRLNAALFGWPSSLLIALLALGAPGARWFRASAVFFLATHFFMRHSGIDTFGPVYFMELAWPILILTAVGYQAAASALAGAASATARHLPAALIVALVLVSLCTYTLVRVSAMAEMAGQINEPERAVQRLGDEKVVVFAQRPFVAKCSGPGTFVLWRPNNDPDLENDVIWVNHIDVERDKQLMKYFPGHVGWVMLWTANCKVKLQRLGYLGPGDVPSGYTGPQEPQPPICEAPWRCFQNDELVVALACSSDARLDASLASAGETTVVEFSWAPRHLNSKRFLDLWPEGAPEFTGFEVRGRSSYVVEIDANRTHSWRLNTQTRRWRSEGWYRFEAAACHEPSATAPVVR